MRYNLPENLDRLAQSQCGVLSAQQAMAGGMTRDMIRARVRNRRWGKLPCGVYATVSGEPARHAVLWAAALRARSRALPSHHTPAQLCDVLDSPRSPIHLTIPHQPRPP